MGFLDNTSITVDAILTKKGRELLARGQNEFKVTKFALADDEVDYNLYDTTHPNGSNFYGAVIENMPLLEAFVDENQLMRYKLTTLPKETAKLPILELPSPSLTFQAAGQTQTITPNTRNGIDTSYTFVLMNGDLANITPVGTAVANSNAQMKSNTFGKGGIVQEEFDTFPTGKGATTAVFLNESERKRSITVVAKSVNLISRSITAQTSTNITVVGNTSGAQFTLPVTVKADPSKV